MERFANLVKKHDGHALRVIPDGKRADGRQAHQEVFVEHLALENIPERPEDDVAADEAITDNKHNQLPGFAEVEEHACGEKDRADDTRDAKSPCFYAAGLLGTVLPLRFLFYDGDRRLMALHHEIDPVIQCFSIAAVLYFDR